MAFGFCFLATANCNSSLAHWLQPQLLLIGIDHHARLPVFLSYSNLTFKDVAGRCVYPVFYLGNALRRRAEKLFVFVVSKLKFQCETINEVHKNYVEDENE